MIGKIFLLKFCFGVSPGVPSFNGGVCGGGVWGGVGVCGGGGWGCGGVWSALK